MRLPTHLAGCTTSIRCLAAGCCPLLLLPATALLPVAVACYCLAPCCCCCLLLPCFPLLLLLATALLSAAVAACFCLAPCCCCCLLLPCFPLLLLLATALLSAAAWLLLPWLYASSVAILAALQTLSRPVVQNNPDERTLRILKEPKKVPFEWCCCMLLTAGSLPHSVRSRAAIFVGVAHIVCSCIECRCMGLHRVVSV